MSRLEIPTPSKAQLVIEGLYRDLERRIEASPPGLCPVSITKAFLELCRTQTCGKCVPCRIGLVQLTNLLADVLDGKANDETLRLLEETSLSIMHSADCAIGCEAARVVYDSLIGCRDDYERHIRDGRCNCIYSQPVPCVAMCPAGVDIPGYISLVAAGRYQDAVRLIRKDNPFPTTCAFICEHPCEARCRRNMVDDAVNIRGLKRVAVDRAGKVPPPECAPDTGKHVCVVGGGPGGLSAAFYLRLMGHKVTVYEMLPKLGGMLRYGIPNYRLPKERLDDDIEAILATGIDVKYGMRIGQDVTIQQLREQYDAVLITIGASTDKKLGLENEDAEGVMSAVKFLRDVGKNQQPDLTGREVCVIGGGNVAMDAARCAKRMGADNVYIVYRRGEAELPARKEEVHHAMEEGIIFKFLTAPTSIEGDDKGRACKLHCVEMQLGEPDASGRRRPSPIEGSDFCMDVDTVIPALGTSPNPLIRSTTPGLDTNKKGCIVTAENGTTSREGVFAGGDASTGAATVILAMGAGKKAAASIDEYLKNK